LLLCIEEDSGPFALDGSRSRSNRRWLWTTSLQHTRRTGSDLPVHFMSSGTSSKRPERFHGAFTGGFSAGFFNSVRTLGSHRGKSRHRPSLSLLLWCTPRLCVVDVSSSRPHGLTVCGPPGSRAQVGTAEGWTPSTFSSSRDKRAAPREQRPEDFMDDEDGLLSEQLQVRK